MMHTRARKTPKNPISTPPNSKPGSASDSNGTQKLISNGAFLYKAIFSFRKVESRYRV